MTSKKTTTVLDLLNGGLPDAGARTAALWSAQAAAAEHVRSYLDAWWKRRQDAAASTAECWARLLGGAADPAASAETLSSWAQDSFERLSEDAKAQAGLASALAGDAVRAWSANGASEEAEPAPRPAAAKPARAEAAK